MFKVLIADDEEIIRTELQRAFQWEEFDMEIAAVAKNGREALEMVRQYRPDVCLLDIKMPFLNGLELIEEINKVDSSVVKIIISGYDEFEFAQRAIRLGVYNYILKPIDEKEFRNMMQEIRDRLRTNTELNQQQKLRNALLETNRPLLEAETFYKWIRAEISTDAAEESLKDFGISFSGKYDLYYIRLYFHISHLGNEEYMEKSIRLCENVFCGRCGAGRKHYSVKTSMDSLVIMMPAEDLQGTDEIVLCRELTGIGDWRAEVYHRITNDLLREAPDIVAELRQEAAADENCSPMVRKIKNYIHEGYEDPQLRLSRFADENNVSLSTLSRLFKKETGMTFMEYLIMYRIRSSIHLLKNTDMRIVEIAEKVGYSSQHYYCDAFKNVMGMSPSKYRKSQR